MTIAFLLLAALGVGLLSVVWMLANIDALTKL